MMISSRQSQAFRRRFALFRYFPVSALSFYYLLQAYLFLFHDIGRRTKVEHNRILLEKSGGVPSPTLLKSGRDISLNHTTQSSNQSHSSRDHQTEGLVDCGCPDTCTLAALSRQINGLSYSCGKRIEYLQSRHQVSGQAQACRIAANEKVPACSPECDPDLCWSNFLQGNQQSAVTEVNNTVTEISTEHVGRSKAMVIAAVPKDENHAVALWTELECLTGGLDLVVFAVPEWSRDIVEKIANQARHKLGLNIMTRYYVNDRYDVGLWCDALSDISGSFMHAADSIKYESIILLNDSVYALRHFTGIQDRLAQSHGQLDMVSLSYYNESSYWLERYVVCMHFSLCILHSCNDSPCALSFCRYQNAKCHARFPCGVHFEVYEPCVSCQRNETMHKKSKSSGQKKALYRREF